MTSTPQNHVTTGGLSSAGYVSPVSLVSLVSHVSPVQVLTDGATTATPQTISTGNYTFSSNYYTASYNTNPFYYTTDGNGTEPAAVAMIEGVEIFLAVVFIALTLATIVGNMMALTVFTRIPVSKTVSVIFFTSMAIADLCHGIFVMPLSVYSLLNENRDLPQLDTSAGLSYCTFSGIVSNTSTKAALFTLILICFDRFIAVYDALHVHLIMTVKNCASLVVTCWIFALLIALFPFMVPQSDTPPDSMRQFANYEEWYNLTNADTSGKYRYVSLATQCNYRVEESFNIIQLNYEIGRFVKEQDEEGVSKLNVNSDFDLSGRVQFPGYMVVSYIFLNILPIIIPTYLIVFFCVAVIVILRRIFKNSKRIIQQIEPPELRRNKSFRASVHLAKELKSLSFKRKAHEKPHITQVDAGYTEIHMGQGTASDHLEGKVVLRRQSRKITQVNANNKSPQLARDRWSQISVKSFQKKTKADHQKKAINTVILMLCFFVFCYALDWFSIFSSLFYYMGLLPSLPSKLSALGTTYFYTANTIMKYVNCAGNPFLYYFRMSQFQKEVRGLTQSWNGTGTNRNQTSGSSRSKKGYIALNGTGGKNTPNKNSAGYKYRINSLSAGSRSSPRNNGVR